MKHSVKVEILNQMRDTELAEMIEKYLNDGYKIQDSEVHWYCGSIEGVYVFTKTLDVELEKENLSELENSELTTNYSVVVKNKEERMRVLPFSKMEKGLTKEDFTKRVESQYLLDMNEWSVEEAREIIKIKRGVE